MEAITRKIRRDDASNTSLPSTAVSLTDLDDAYLVTASQQGELAAFDEKGKRQ